MPVRTVNWSKTHSPGGKCWIQRFWPWKTEPSSRAEALVRPQNVPAKLFLIPLSPDIRKYSLTLLAIFLLISCKKEVETTEETRTVTDTINNASLDAKPAISIKDSSQYSAEFIKELETLEDPSIKNIELIEGYMLLDKDTVYFPSELKLNLEIDFFS